MKPRRHMPLWVMALIAALAAIDPITHLVLTYALPERLAATGFHIGDTPFFLTAMAAGRNGFFSPYALCDPATAAFADGVFSLPHHYLYMLLGVLAQALGLSDFIALGLANAAFGAFYLAAVWCFMQAALPRMAPRAFLLFTLGGGIAGAIYLIASASGMAGTTSFEGWFHRYARYEMIEGPFLSPLLVMPRLYYTLPLGLGYWALTHMARTLYGHAPEASATRRLGMASIVLCIATLFNARVGLLLLGAELCLLLASRQPARLRITWGIVLATLVVAITLAIAAVLSGNPTTSENVGQLLRRSVWFGSLLSATLLFLPALCVALRSPLRALPLPWRAGLFAALGYLSAFALLYALHQTYWGNLLAGGDAAAAVAVSDWALLGALPGVALALRSRPLLMRYNPMPAALALWLLGAVAVGVSAWGHGAFLVAMPERTLAVCGVPLALLAARGLHQCRLSRRTAWRRYARLGFAALLFGGLLSNAVAAFYFQGPLGVQDFNEPFAWAHSEVMAPEDVHLIEAIDGGVVLAPASMPPLLGDVAVHRHPGLRTVFGQPSLEFAGTNMLTLIQQVQRFFDPAQLDAFDHQAAAATWCVDYILCPQTRPVAAETLAFFRAQPWLEEVMGERDIALFRVRQEVAP